MVDPLQVIKEGFLVKQGAVVKNWKRRFFVLTYGNLSYYKAKGDSNPAGTIQLEGSIIEESTSSTNSFAIKTLARTYYIAAETSEDYEEWIKALKPVALTTLDSQEKKPKKLENEFKIGMSKTNVDSLSADGLNQICLELHTLYKASREDVIRTAARNHRFTCEQLCGILGKLSFADERIFAVKQIAPKLSDLENIEKIYSCLTFEYEKRRVKEIIGK